MLTPEQISAICARHGATIGMSGSGKTYTEKGFAEWLLSAKRHTVIVDPLGAWWGLRTSADGEGDGYPIVIFGGEHADVEIGVWDGAAVADVVLRDVVSCIIDLSGFRTGADQRLFMEGFIGALRGKPKGTLNLIVDEADEFAPETVQDKVGNRLKEDMVWIAKRGRMSGFILHIITQRPADIAKSVLTQCQSLTVHQLIAPQDQKPAEDWLKGNGDKVVLRSVMESLAGLETGERWVYSPKNKILDRGMSPAIWTFDSSRTPEPGETIVEVKTIAQLDVSAIRGALEKPPEEVAPAARMEELEVAHERLEDVTAENEALRGEVAHWQGKAIAADVHQGVIRGSLEEIGDALRDVTTKFESALLLVADVPVPELVEVEIQEAAIPPPARPVAHVRSVQDRAPPAPAPEPAGDVTLGATASAFADMLDKISPARVTWAALAAMTGRKARGGNFNTARRQLRDSGRMVEEGDKLRSSKPAPRGMMRRDIAAVWRGVLTGRAPEIFDLLAEAVNPMTKDEIGEALGLVTRGGNWNGIWAQLRNNDLIEGSEGGGFQLASKLPGER